MHKGATLRLSTVAAVVGLIALAGAGAAFPSPPANDNFADATAISSLPFTDDGDLNGTTTEPGEPLYCTYQPQTVWYSFTASSTTALKADLSGSQGGVLMTIFQSSGGGLGSLSFMGCSFGGSLVIAASANTTYYIQVGSYIPGPVQMQLGVQEIPPPPNDDFAAAIPIGLPFSGTTDMTAATTEPGEPLAPGGLAIAASAWYAFTATGSHSLTASTNSCCSASTLAVYTGSSVDGLTEVRAVMGQMLTFIPAAGTTYYFQVGRGAVFGGSGSVQMPFQLALTPPPVAQLGFSPFDPSSFDAVQFFSFSYDPVGIGIQSWAWDFGDGSSATGVNPTHRFAADGDYTVGLTVTTVDGRHASASQLLHVKTHDVAITKFTVPNAASAGQTRQVSVGLSNGRYPETVLVQLFKSVPGGNGFQFVGALTQFVPLVPGNHTVPFDFSYTFTPDDAAVGKVTFQAVASIQGARDAQPADNTAISLPTKVNH